VLPTCFDMKQVYPWEGRPPLLTLFRQSKQSPEESLLSPNTTDDIRFVDGAPDGISLYSGPLWEPLSSDEIVPRTIAALENLIHRASSSRRRALYLIFLQEALVNHRLELTTALLKKAFPREKLRPHALWLIENATHIEPLKLGMLLLGLSGTPGDVSVLLLLARHNELTLFAAEAVCSLSQNPTAALWEMAKNVHGWGKIHAVEKLAPYAAHHPEIRGWLLRHGCQNEIMYEYLAHTCATAGHLADALSAETIDRELLDGACLILDSLDSPGKGWDQYPEGVTATFHLLRHLKMQEGEAFCHVWASTKNGGIEMKLFWVFSFLGSMIGAGAFYLTLTKSDSAMQEASGSVIALCFCIIPYVFARSVEGQRQEVGRSL
jgi:hypothetical protein